MSDHRDQSSVLCSYILHSSLYLAFVVQCFFVECTPSSRCSPELIVYLLLHSRPLVATHESMDTSVVDVTCSLFRDVSVEFEPHIVGCHTSGPTCLFALHRICRLRTAVRGQRVTDLCHCHGCHWCLLTVTVPTALCTPCLCPTHLPTPCQRSTATDHTHPYTEQLTSPVYK